MFQLLRCKGKEGKEAKGHPDLSKVCKPFMKTNTLIPVMNHKNSIFVVPSIMLYSS